MQETQLLYNELMNKVRKYQPSDKCLLIEKAYNLAENAHSSQIRKSGEPYIIHPLNVAIILAGLQLDCASITAGLLHDVIEDTKYSFEDIEQMFSTEIAELVNGVTKLKKISYCSKEEEQAENYRKMFLAMGKDIRVILIKVADRLHNMRTLNYMSEKKQLEKAKETLEIYAPIANRLGISKIKVELEDLAFKYLNPQDYYDLSDKVKQKQSERQMYVDKIVSDIKQKLTSIDINANVYGRSKHFFSIYKKMINKDKTFEQIFDLTAIRIIVDDIKDCYAALGIVHEMYKPVPRRFKDYIAMPKPNMYQSLHTTLIGPEGKSFEIQIRTNEMHQIAEYGIAAHWKYKEGISDLKQKSEEQKLSWLRQILEWQKDMSDNEEFLETVKTDLDVFSENVYCFSPTGEVKILPYGSTPVDFAYCIHSVIGNTMVGAKVNEKIVTFEHKLKNGDMIEIITSKNSKGPKQDWLKFVKSSQAKAKITGWFKKINKEENITRGQELLEKDAKKKGHSFTELATSERIEKVLKKYNFKDWSSICASIGHGGLKEGQVVNRFIEEYEKNLVKHTTFEEDMLESQKAILETNAKKQSTSRKNNSKVIIQGIDSVEVRMSRCCSPVPEDEIVGFITRGRGISIHRKDCSNITDFVEKDGTRLLEASWNLNNEKFSVSANVRLIGMNRKGYLGDITKILNEQKIDIVGLNARTIDSQVLVDLSVTINSRNQLDHLIRKLNTIKGTYDVQRI